MTARYSVSSCGPYSGVDIPGEDVALEPHRWQTRARSPSDNR